MLTSSDHHQHRPTNVRQGHTSHSRYSPLPADAARYWGTRDSLPHDLHTLRLNGQRAGPRWIMLLPASPWLTSQGLCRAQPPWGVSKTLSQTNHKYYERLCKTWGIYYETPVKSRGFSKLLSKTCYKYYDRQQESRGYGTNAGNLSYCLEG